MFNDQCKINLANVQYLNIAMLPATIHFTLLKKDCIIIVFQVRNEKKENKTKQKSQTHKQV